MSVARAIFRSAQASYDLRRLRLKGFIERVPHTNSYRVTAHGRRMATFFTKLAARVVVPTLTGIEATLRPPKATPQPVRDAWRAYERTLDALVRKRLAA
ncbi:MAG: hypothetical protein ACRD1D_04045 [Acidimicrobiales bacterium]